MRCLILCGGKGTRLKSITQDSPKSIVPVAKIPFIFYLFDLIIEKSVKEITLCTGIGHRQIKNKVGDRYKSLSITYSQESKPLGTGGAILKAIQNFKDEQFLVLNGDSYCNFDFPEITSEIENKSLIFTHKVSNVSRYGEVVFDKNFKVTSFEEKNETNRKGFINAGIYLFQRTDIENFPQNTYISLENDILPKLIGNLSIVPCEGDFIDIGTPDSYKEAERFFAKELKKTVHAH
ncbi:sugar phosphate nucleotidyltransferase [Opitutales bacterium]|nr:sugar phosphate nucleotidyltransferase [Opitutales bacterium]